MFSLKNRERKLSIRTERVRDDDRAFLVKVSQDGKLTREFEVLAMRTTDDSHQPTTKVPQAVCKLAV